MDFQPIKSINPGYATPNGKIIPDILLVNTCNDKVATSHCLYSLNWLMWGCPTSKRGNSNNWSVLLDPVDIPFLTKLPVTMREYTYMLNLCSTNDDSKYCPTHYIIGGDKLAMAGEFTSFEIEKKDPCKYCYDPLFCLVEKCPVYEK